MTEIKRPGERKLATGEVQRPRSLLVQRGDFMKTRAQEALGQRELPVGQGLTCDIVVEKK